MDEQEWSGSSATKKLSGKHIFLHATCDSLLRHFISLLNVSECVRMFSLAKNAF